jgi:hypothetical protein
MKIEQFRTMAHGDVGNFHGAKQAVKTLLLGFVYGRRAFVQYGKCRSMQDEPDEGNTLLFAQAQKIFPVVHGVQVVQLDKMLQSKYFQELANAIINNDTDCQLRGC